MKSYITPLDLKVKTRHDMDGAEVIYGLRANDALLSMDTLKGKIKAGTLGDDIKYTIKILIELEQARLILESRRNMSKLAGMVK